MTCVDPTTCDGGSTCNPTTGLCVEDPDAPLSTDCELDNDLCTGEHCDGAGNCVDFPGGDVTTCHAANPPCEAGEVCNPGTGACDALPDAPLSTPCEADDDLCTNDHCDGKGQCVLDFVTICDDPLCDACNPVTGVCEVIDPPPAGCGTVCCLPEADEDDDADDADGGDEDDDADDDDGGLWGGFWADDDEDDDADDDGPEIPTTCVELDEEACLEAGGTPLDGTCTEIQACCLPGGEDDDDADDDDGGDGAVGDDDDGDDDGGDICLDIDPLCCEAAGGTPLGPGSQCVVDDDDGDSDGDDGLRGDGLLGDDEDDAADDSSGDDLECPEPPVGASKPTSPTRTSPTPVSPVRPDDVIAPAATPRSVGRAPATPSATRTSPILVWPVRMM